MNYNNDELLLSSWTTKTTNTQNIYIFFPWLKNRSIASVSQQGSLLCAAMMKVCATKKVEVQCLNVATTFIEFAQKYLNLEFTNVTKIIYPQY